jgi:hypothetical protein
MQLITVILLQTYRCQVPRKLIIINKPADPRQKTKMAIVWNDGHYIKCQQALAAPACAG